MNIQLAKKAASWALVIFGALPACGSDGSNPGPPGANPSPSGTANDAGPPAPVSRAMITVPFQEGMAAQNRLLDPTLLLDAGNAWFFTDLATGAAAHVTKTALARTPAGQASFFVSASANPNGAALGAVFKVPAVAYDASLWLGAASTDTLGVTPSTLTFDENGLGNPHAVELSPDTDPSGTKDLDGIHWVRYVASITPDLVSGWGYLYVAVEDSKHDIWLAGPQVVASATSDGIRARPRALLPSEDLFARTMRARPRPHPEFPWKAPRR